MTDHTMKQTIITLDGDRFLVMEATNEDLLMVFRGETGDIDGRGSLTAFNPLRRKVIAAYRALAA
jgi:hypothetical protein